MSRTWTLLKAVLLCTVLVACESAEDRAEKHYQSALELIENGDFARAEIEFRNVFDLNGQHREARSTYANMLLDLDRTGEANSQFLRLAEQFPNDAETRDVLTRLALDRQDWDEAKRHGERLEEVSPGNVTSQVASIALAYRDASLETDTAKQSEVAAQARAMVAEHDDYIVLRFILVQQAVVEEDAEAALRELDAVLAVWTDNVGLYQYRLQLLAGLNRFDEIETQLISLIDQFPEDRQFLASLLQFYASQNRGDDAITFLTAYVEEKPEDQEAINSLIDIVAQLRGVDAAIEEIDRLLSGEGDPIVLLVQRARYQFETGNRNEAIAAMENLLERDDIEDSAATAKLVLARMLLAEANEVGARRQVEEVLATDGTNVAALKMQANWLVADDNPDEAINLLRTAIDNAPDDWGAMLMMADAFSRAGNHELSRDFVSLAVETSDSAPGPALRYADLLISEERLILAEETLVAALRRNPDTLELLSKLGQVQVMRQDWPRVEQIERTLARLDSPDAARVAVGLEVARLAGQARVDEAISTLDQLAESDGSFQTVTAVIRARLGSGDTEGALELAQSSIADNPDNLGFQLIYASTLAASGDVAQAKVQMEEILAVNDQIEAAWTGLLRLTAADDDPESSAQVLERALAAIPNSPSLLWAKASMLTVDGDMQGAIAVYEDMYERNSDSLIIANNLATLLVATQDDAETLERAFNIARRLRGTDVPAFQDTYGWIMFKRGDLVEAETYLKSAADALPNEPSVLYHLGSVYLAQDRRGEALALFQRSASFEDLTDQFPQIELAREQAATLEAEGVEPVEN